METGDLASETLSSNGNHSSLLGRDKWGKQCNVHNDKRELCMSPDQWQEPNVCTPRLGVDKRIIQEKSVMAGYSY